MSEAFSLVLGFSLWSHRSVPRRPCWNCGGQNGAVTVFSPSTSVFLCQYQPPNAQILIYISPTLYKTLVINIVIKQITKKNKCKSSFPRRIIMKLVSWFGHPYPASSRLTLALRIFSSSVLIVPHGDAMRTENWRTGHWGDSWYNTSIPWCGHTKK